MFKAGDRVKLISEAHGDHLSNPLWGGKCGKVSGVVYKPDYEILVISFEDTVFVNWNNGQHNCYSIRDLEFANNINCKDILVL